MAKYENDGYCPNIWVPKKWTKDSDPCLFGLWSLVGDSIVYTHDPEPACNPDINTCDKVFSTDPIAVNLLTAMVRKNVNADKILVHQIFNGGCNKQSNKDIGKVLGTSKNPEIITAPKSEFLVVLSDADYGMDVWIWDLNSTW